MRVVTRNDWPNLAWHPLPRAAFLTLAQAPVPFVQLKRAGRGDEEAVRAFLGCPVPLDPQGDYEWRNVANPDLDRLTAIAAADGVRTWYLRKTELVLSPHPVPLRGIMRQVYAITNANAAGHVQYHVRTTCEGLRYFNCTWYSAGIVTSARTFAVDLYGDLPQGVAELADALSAGTHFPQTWGECQQNDPIGGVGRGWMPPAIETWANFPVTTTPTLWAVVSGTLA